ncbi:AAA family ATPase [Eubacterium oxidoreducens]|uniref:Exodeoxyribonuclease V alpha subunit n=1 Tax=Eubacterium oxidoreducens TaxID=1732 RepID=A0A1G6C3Q2_EUBOX|nr:AAA family ATPase [Eubacterium oxidoreducens]SDB27464.1 exodeoxyribonuclease V alpha subunit [Eubacterium oxidoreducens]
MTKQIDSTFYGWKFSSEVYQIATEVTNNNFFTAKGQNIPSQLSTLCGDWKEDAHYGKYFEVASAKIRLPQGADEVRAFLMNMKLPNMKDKRISEFVRKFPCLSAMEDVKKIASIRGITLDKAEGIKNAYLNKMERYKFHNAFSCYFELSKKQEKEAFKRFSGNVESLSKNPYLLLWADSINFRQIDEKVKKTSIWQEDSPIRITAGLHQAFKNAERQGQVCLQKQTSLKKSYDILFGSHKKSLNMQKLDTLKNKVRESLLEEEIAEYNGFFYRKDLYEAEKKSAIKIAALLRRQKTFCNVKESIREAEKEKKISLAPSQKEAIKKGIENNFSIITGGPGTGKTTTLNTLLCAYLKVFTQTKICLCAPTGRASRRMTENTKMDARTIHSLLGIHSDYEEPQNKIDADLVVVDEASMCSQMLFASLMSAISVNTTVILVGDKNQLPSVSAGNVLEELILSGTVPTTTLTVTFRQKEGSAIISNASKILEYKGKGELRLDEASDFAIRFVESEEEGMSVLFEELSKSKVSFDNRQVLTPMKKVQLGTQNLNGRLQNAFNPSKAGKPEIRYGKSTFRLGDRVIYLNNDKDVSNGDMGVITQINDAQGFIFVKFSTKILRKFERHELDALTLAYAMTVHKSQGSEFSEVYIPWTKEFKGMRLKRLLYTAVTRATKKVVLICDKESLSYIGTPSAEIVRFSNLGKLLKEATR